MKLNMVSSKMSKNKKGKLSKKKKQNKTKWLFYVAQYLYGYDGLDMRNQW